MNIRQGDPELFGLRAQAQQPPQSEGDHRSALRHDRTHDPLLHLQELGIRVGPNDPEHEEQQLGRVERLLVGEQRPHSLLVPVALVFGHRLLQQRPDAPLHPLDLLGEIQGLATEHPTHSRICPQQSSVLVDGGLAQQAEHLLRCVLLWEDGGDGSSDLSQPLDGARAPRRPIVRTQVRDGVDDLDVDPTHFPDVELLDCRLRDHDCRHLAFPGASSAIFLDSGPGASSHRLPPVGDVQGQLLAFSQPPSVGQAFLHVRRSLHRSATRRLSQRLDLELRRLSQRLGLELPTIVDGPRLIQLLGKDRRCRRLTRDCRLWLLRRLPCSSSVSDGIVLVLVSVDGLGRRAAGEPQADKLRTHRSYVLASSVYSYSVVRALDRSRRRVETAQQAQRQVLHQTLVVHVSRLRAETREAARAQPHLHSVSRQLRRDVLRLLQALDRSLVEDDPHLHPTSVRLFQSINNWPVCEDECRYEQAAEACGDRLQPDAGAFPLGEHLARLGEQEPPSHVRARLRTRAFLSAPRQGRLEGCANGRRNRRPRRRGGPCARAHACCSVLWGRALWVCARHRRRSDLLSHAGHSLLARRQLLRPMRRR